MPDMQSLMKQAAAMQASVQQQQATLADSTFEGSAGGGMITAVIRGTGKLVEVTIDPSVLDPDDAELVGDLVVAAVNDAHRVMSEAAGEAMGGIPGMDLESMGLGGPDLSGIDLEGLDLGGLGDLLK